MTVTALPSRNEYTAAAGQTIFNFTFLIFEDTDLNVYVTPSGQDAEDSTDIVTGYTVAGLGNPSGGSITLSVGASIGDLVTIVSDIPENRTTDYQNSGDFLPDTVNDDFDKTVALIKQQDDSTSRTLSFQQSEQNAASLVLPGPKAGYFLQWRGDLLGMQNVASIPESGGGSADLVVYDNTNSGVPGVNVQDAIDQATPRDSYAAMLADTSLSVGQFVQTISHIDGAGKGGGSYEVVAGGTGTADNFLYGDTADGLQVLLVDDEKNIFQAGAVADCNTTTGAGTDDGPIFNTAMLAVGTGSVFVPDGNYKFTPANRLLVTNTSGPLLGRLVGESRGGVLLCGVGFTGEIPVVDFEPTISSTSDHGCGGIENATIISAPFVAEGDGSGLRLTGAQGGMYRNIAIRGFTNGLWLYNDDNSDHYTENNDFEHFYIHQCLRDIHFSLEQPGSANTSFNGTRMKHMNVNAYDGQTVLNINNFALLYHSQIQINSWAVTGTVTLINVNSDAVVRPGCIIDFYNEVTTGAAATPLMFISGTATAAWRGTFDQVEGAFPKTAFPVGAFTDYSRYNDVAQQDITAIDSGSNANGQWIKYPDGTLIMTHQHAATGTAETITFPETMINTSYSINASPTASSGAVNVSAKPHNLTTTTFDLVVVTAGAYAGQAICYTAVGRWK